MNTPNDLDDIWFLSVEVLALVAIIGLAWTWRSDTVVRVEAEARRETVA